MEAELIGGSEGWRQDHDESEKQSDDDSLCRCKRLVDFGKHIGDSCSTFCNCDALTTKLHKAVTTSHSPSLNFWLHFSFPFERAADAEE